MERHCPFFGTPNVDGEILVHHHAANRASQFAASVIVIPFRPKKAKRQKGKKGTLYLLVMPLVPCPFFYIYYNSANNSHHPFRGAPMTTAEKISIALPPEMVHLVRGAVATGEYASSSEVIRDALRDWTYKRSLRQQGVAELRRVWQEALNDKTSDISPDEVLDRLERKYQAIADGFFRHT